MVLPYGNVLFSELVVPGLFPRLAKVASTFQRIRYNKLVLRIVPQVSTTASGGYVCAFVADPADEIPEGEQSVSHLISQRGSVANKWWQNSTYPITLPQQWYYTSRGVDVREYSPGSINVVSTGESSQPGSLIVYAEWNVSLMTPTIERENDVSKAVLLKHDVYLRKGYEGLFAKVNGKFEANVKFFFDEVPDVKAYKLPNPAYVQDGADVASSLIKVCFYLIRTGNTVTLGTTSTEAGMGNNALSDTLLLQEGTVLEPVQPQLNRLAPLLTGPTMAEPTDLSRECLERLTEHLLPQLRSLIVLERENQKPRLSIPSATLPDSN